MKQRLMECRTRLGRMKQRIPLVHHTGADKADGVEIAPRAFSHSMVDAGTVVYFNLSMLLLILC